MKLDFLRIGAAVLLATAGCSSDSEEGAGATSPAATGTPTNPAGTATAGTGTLARAGAGAPAARPPLTGASGAAAPSAGSTATAPGTVKPPASTPGTVAAGSGGTAGAPASGAKAGTGGNSAAAGSGAAAGGGAPAAGGSEGGGFIREAAPTEASVKGNGEFTVKSYTERDGLVGGDAYGDAANGGDGSELYYPEGAKAPFAAMVIVPGFTAQRSDVAPWGEFLASHGIVSLVIDTNTTGDLPDVRSTGLLDAVESLKKENAREGSPVKGQLDTTRIGLMGWSMGGGGTWLSADAHPEIKVAVSLCGWILDSVGSKTSVPSLQLAVIDDELAAGMSQPVYAAIPDATPKMLVEWNGGGHWINNSPESKGGEVGGYGLPWIKVYLEGDERYRELFKRMPPGTSDYSTNQ